MQTFGELEAVVMQVVWSHGEPVTVRAIADELNETRPLAYTTIGTITERLRAKGALDRVLVGRSFQYTAVQSAEAYTAQLLGEALKSAASPSAVEAMAGGVPRLLRHQRCKQRRHRSRQRTDRAPPAHRPRLSQPRQLPTPHAPHRGWAEAMTTLSGEEPAARRLYGRCCEG